MALLKRVRVLALLLVAPACAIVTGLDRDFDEVACLRACADGAADGPNAPPGDGGPHDAGATDAGHDAHVAQTLLTSLPGIIDFDVVDDAALLTFSRTRIDRCVGTACTRLVAAANMPPESSARTNASLAYVPEKPGILVAQSGHDTCATGCGDNLDVASLWTVDTIQPSPAVRRAPTLPLGVAKSGRDTDGWLVGRGDTWALAQTTSNEAPPDFFTAVYAWRTSDTVAHGPASLGRGHGGFGGPFQPLVFVATPTAAGKGGFAGAGLDFVDVSDPSRKAGVVPKLAAVTTIDRAASVVFVQGVATSPGKVLAFPNAETLLPAPYDFPELGVDAAALVATTSWLGFIDAGAADAGVALAFVTCRVAAVLAGSCAPERIPLPLETVVRVRTVNDGLWFLGRGTDASTKIVKLSL